MIVVRKRDGATEDFNANKIVIAITKAMSEEFPQLTADHLSMIDQIAEEIVEIVEFNVDEIFSVEEIQDLVEMKLMEKDLYSIAKRYILYRAKRAEVREQAWEMTELERGILENRYMLDGEDFEMWLDRVSGGNRAIKKRIRNKEFLFGGRILASRNTQHLNTKATPSNCFHPSMKILTKDGYKRIDKVQEGELVLTNDGTYNPVNKVLISDFEGELITFSSPSLNGTIKATPNHPMLTQEGWRSAEEIYDRAFAHSRHGKKFNLQGIFHPREVEEKTINVKAFLSDSGLFLKEEDGYTFVKNPGCRKGGSMFSDIVIDEDVQYFIGRYLGDGSITPRSEGQMSIFQIVFNAAKEEEEFDKCWEIATKKLGVTPTTNHNPSQGTLVLKVNGEAFGTFMEKLVGRTSTKRIPDFLMSSLALAKGFLDADGMVLKEGNVRIVLANKGLVESLAQVLRNNGINTPIPKEVENNGFVAYEFRLAKLVSRYLIPSLLKKYEDDRMLVETPTEKIYDIPLLKRVGKEEYRGKVYNLSVENNHNYVVEGAIAHNCFVVSPPEDSIEGIYKTAAEMARTYSYGGGVGVSLRNLRPRGAVVANSAEQTSGAVSFMELYDMTTKVIGQAGRRGALMISMPISHPDIEEFINVKTDMTKITKANTSIEMTDEFMEAVKNDAEYTTKFEFESRGEKHKVEKPINARKLFATIAKNNWIGGEPGMLFWEKISNYHLMAAHPGFEFAGTNP